MTEWPKITLVTPSYNQGRFIEATIRSVLDQGYPNLEYFVIDGGSTDESLEIIQRYGDRLSWWVSEPDGGQVDAIKKGFARGTGRIFNWLNSDDLLLPGALFEVGKAYAANSADIIVGRDRHFSKDIEQPVFRFVPSGYAFPDCLRYWTGRFRYHQPPTFFSAKAYLNSGGLNSNLHYAMDFDLYCRMLRLMGCKTEYLETELTAFRLHEAAKTSKDKDRFVAEMRAVSRSYWPMDWGIEEQQAMDRHSAECSLYQGAEALRNLKVGKFLQAIAAGMGYSPRHFINFARQRIQARFQ